MDLKEMLHELVDKFVTDGSKPIKEILRAKGDKDGESIAKVVESIEENLLGGHKGELTSLFVVGTAHLGEGKGAVASTVTGDIVQLTKSFIKVAQADERLEQIILLTAKYLMDNQDNPVCPDCGMKHSK